VSAVVGIDRAVAAWRLRGRDLRLGFGTRDTESGSSAGSGGGILGLAVAAVVVVGETLLVGGVEGRVLATSSSGRLDRGLGLVGERLRDLRLGLGDLLGERVEGLLLRLGVTGKVVEGVGVRGLGDRREARGGAPSSTSLHRGRTLGGREGGTRSNGRVLRGLSAGLGLLAVLINVNCVAVQAHATELNSSTVHSVVTGHDDSLLLLHDTALETRGPALLGSARRIGRRGETGGSSSGGSSSGVHTTANGAGGGRSGSGSGHIGNTFKVGLSQVVLELVGRGVRNGRNDGLSGLCDGGLLRSGGHWSRFGSGGRSRNGWFSDGLGRLLGSRSRGSRLRLLLRRRRGWFGEETSPPLLCSLGDHTTLGFRRLGGPPCPTG
jgi:hypothetical protein